MPNSWEKVQETADSCNGVDGVAFEMTGRQCIWVRMKLIMTKSPLKLVYSHSDPHSTSTYVKNSLFYL